MRLRNAHTEAAVLRDRWLEQYGGKPESHGLAERLRALRPDPTPDEVDAAFSGWVGRGSSNRVDREFACHECGLMYPEVVRLGEEPDHESKTADVCAACLFLAMRLVDGE